MRGSASSGTWGAQAYGEAWYWDKRYSQDQDPAAATFDWYQKYPSLAPLFHLYIPPSSPSHPHLRLLVVGCGNSGMSFYPFFLFDQGSCLPCLMDQLKTWVGFIHFFQLKMSLVEFFCPINPFKDTTEYWQNCSVHAAQNCNLGMFLELASAGDRLKWWQRGDGNAAWTLFACLVF